jgi:hypothetical protein
MKYQPGGRMKLSKLKSAAMVAAVIGGAVSARASVLLYSFESGDSPNALDGFAHNGGGITVESSTTGATNGSGSMEVDTTGSAGGFVGILSTSPAPLATLDNAAVTSVSFDVTVPASPVFAGGFSDMGITLFVANPALGEYGEQYQTDFTPDENIDLAPGTSTITIPLQGADPDNTSDDVSYAQLLADGFVPTGFEFFIDNNAPETVFVDNVEANGIGAVPEPASIGMCMVLGGLLVRRRNRKA